MKNNYFIIHGSFGSPFSNWIPWLRKEIENREEEDYTPDLPTGVGYQNYRKHIPSIRHITRSKEKSLWSP